MRFYFLRLPVVLTSHVLEVLHHFVDVKLYREEAFLALDWNLNEKIHNLGVMDLAPSSNCGARW